MTTATANPFEMTVPAPGGGGKFENPPPGNHPARLVAIIDLGSQADNFNPGKFKRQCFLVWELIGVTMTGMKDVNHLIGERYTTSLNEKAKLRGMVKTWRGKDLKDDEKFDLTVMLGKPCLVTVAEVEGKDDKTYANLAGVSSVPKGMACGEPQRKPVFWFIGCGEDLPEWLPYCYGQKPADIIGASREMAQARGGKPAPAAGIPGYDAPEEDAAPF
jgi:hypothetical protein